MQATNESKRSRILFVDDEQSVLDGLRRTLHGLRGSWDMTFLSCATEAATLIEKQPFDVVVADMRMPRMNGADLLEHVRRVSPASVRIMFSAHNEVSAIMKSVGPSHQFLSKPCTRDVIEKAIRRACTVRESLSSPRLAETLGRIRAVPSLPSIYQQLVVALQDDLPMEHIGDIIRRDFGLTTKVLQLVNSSYFGLAREVNDPAQAAALLGSDTLSSLVLSLKLFESLPPIVLPGVAPDQIIRDGIWTGAATRILCSLEHVGDVFASQAFIAGFLHDVGLLTLAAYAPELVQRVDDLIAAGAPLGETERQVIGATHGDVGGHLVALWGFADPVVEAILYHHCPLRSAGPGLTPLTLVHVAQALSPQAETNRGSQQGVDEEYLRRVGVLERLPEWRAGLERLPEEAT